MTDATLQFECEDLDDVHELLERAANYHAAAHHEVIAAELRQGARVVAAEVAGDE
jgi:hypothetical protein